MLHHTFDRFSALRRAALPLILVTSTLQAQDGTVAVVDSLPAMSRSSLATLREEAMARRLASFGVVAPDLRRIYGTGESALLWTHEGALTPSARATLEALGRVADRGLDPAAVDLERLQALAVKAAANDGDRLTFDLELSAASLRTLRALHGVTAGGNDGRVGGSGNLKAAVAGNRGIGGRPRAAADSSAQPATASTIPSTLDLTPELRALAAGTRADSVLDAAEPASTQYRLLRNAVGTYRTLGERSDVAKGQLTRILATLERARAQRDSDLTAGVVVNIPAFRLQATGTDSAADSLGMDVVVGVAGTHRTPEMRDSIRYIVFAPYWDVPNSILRGELLPIARRDPHLLTLNNYEIVDRRGKVLPATAASVKLLAAGKARVRQLPGGTNALGKVKFMFPNKDDVYLHDTPNTTDFRRWRRDQSHGCVRVGDPMALAQWLLRDQPEWTTERITEAMNAKAPVTVKLTRPLPIRLTYATAVARADGSIDFFDDIYGLDGSK